MATNVIIDVSLLAQGLIPDDAWVTQAFNREFGWVCPGALYDMATGVDPEGAQILDQLLRAYQKFAEAGQPAGPSLRLRRKNNQPASEPPLAEVTRLLNTLVEEDLVTIYKPGHAAAQQQKKAPWAPAQPAQPPPQNVSVESQWIARQNQENHLHFRLREAYQNVLGLQPHLLLDQYFSEVLAGLTIGEDRPPRARLWLASVGTATFDVLSQATGPLIFKVEDIAGNMVGVAATTVRSLAEDKDRFFKGFVPPGMLDGIVKKGLEPQIGRFFDSAPETLLAGAAIATGLFVIADGGAAMKVNQPNDVLTTRGCLLALLGVFGALFLMFIVVVCCRDKLCDLLCADERRASTETPLAPPTAPTVLIVGLPPSAVGPIFVATVATPAPGMIVIYACTDCATGCPPGCAPNPPPPVGPEIHGFGGPEPRMPPAGGHHPGHGGAPMGGPYPGGHGGSFTYIVHPGDTVYCLARRFGVSPQAIASANGLSNPNVIWVGQVLVIPQPFPY